MKRNIQQLPALLAGACALVLSAGALAQQGQSRMNQPTNQPPSSTERMQTDPAMNANNSSMNATAQSKFDALDTNHDGSIDKQEASASKALNAEFSKLDADKNGKLTLTEFMSASNLASIKVDRKVKQKEE